MKLPGILAALLTLCFCGFPASADGHLERIKFGWGATIHGYAYWTIWQDDIMEFEAGFGGARPNMPGWRWKNLKKYEGKARFRNAGAYLLARSIADTALTDPALSLPPEGELTCLDAGSDFFWFDPIGEDPSITLDGCISDTSDFSTKERAYYRRVQRLLKELITTLEIDTVIDQ